MNKIMRTAALLVALVLASAAAFAQQQEKQNRDRTWFMGLDGGLNVGFDGHSYATRNTSHVGAGVAAGFYFGRWFGRVVGLRAGYTGINVSNHYTDFGQVGFHYGHADILLKINEMVVPYLHTGFVWMDAGSPTFGAGFMMPIRLGRNLSLVPDIRYTALNGHAFKDGEVHFAGNLSVTVGLRYDFGRVQRNKAKAPKAPKTPKVSKTAKPAEAVAPKAEAPKPEPVTVYVRDTIYVKQTTVVMEEAPVGPRPLPGVVPIEFADNASTLSANATLQLQTVISYLKQESGASAILTSYRRGDGSDEFAAWLSERRVQAIREFLEANGIPSWRISVNYQPSAPQNKVEIGFVRE